MATFKTAPMFGKPVPTWMQDAQAQRAAEHAAPPAPPELPLATELVQPWRRVQVAELPSAAATFARRATAAGYVVAARMAGSRAAQVGVRERDRNALWMRATWSRTETGSLTAKGASIGGRAVSITVAGYMLDGMSMADALRRAEAESAARAEAAAKRKAERAAAE